MHRETISPVILHTFAPGVQRGLAGSYDCDCACALDPPFVIRGGSRSGFYDCDCACASRAAVVGSAAGSYDCDCACALTVPQGLDVQSDSLPWTRRSQALPIPLEDGWQAYYNPGGPVGVAVLNTEAQRVLAAFDAPIPPQDAVETVLDLSPATVRGTIHDLFQAGLLHPAAMPPLWLGQVSTLSAWLHVTETCNLNCPYCYVHKRPRNMALDVGYLVVNRLVDAALRHGYSALKLKFAGGEPTLRLPLIQALHAHASRRTAETGLELEQVILTNGVGVTGSMLDWMARAGMELMVSLDGDSASHDRLRASRDGRSTHAAVTATVERALERGLHPSISITLTALNLEGAAAAVSFALERDLPFNLNFYRECIGADTAGPSQLMPDPARLVEAVQDIFALIRTQPGYSRPLTGILDRTRLDLPHRSACSAGRDYLVFDADGRISACQMLLEEPWTDLSDDDPLQTIRLYGEPIFRPVEARVECQECPWRAACAGGCPLMHGTTLHKRYCQVYQTLFPELIRVEASRLISNHSAVATHSL